MDRPTIFAKASGSGRAGVAVVRVSGVSAAEAVRVLAGALPAPRVASLRTLRDPHSGDALDRALVLWFPAPHSFTGDDVSEFHLHGGRAVVSGVVSALGRMAGLRPAEPGEFTRQAFRNRKMDLAEVEGLADLIEAETEMQRRQALRQLEGALGSWAQGLRADLIEALALAEARIDFADEPDLSGDYDAELRQRITAVVTGIEAQLAAAASGEKLREGVVVAIAGPPNVGKSTLLNSLAGRDAAIVSAYAGTTRDTIEVDLDLRGLAMRLIDTAGLRETQDPLEQEGIRRARSKAAGADLVLWLDDGSAETMPVSHARLWRLRTKADIAVEPTSTADFVISAQTGAGLETLLAALADFAAGLLAGGETALVTRLRHRQALETALRHLGAVLRAGTEPELVAEDLRGATDALASLVGAVETEEVLGGIFARFCIGK